MNTGSTERSDTLARIGEYLAASLLGTLFAPVALFIIELFAKTGGELKWQLPVIAGVLAPVVCFAFLRGCSNTTRIIAALLLAGMVAKALFVASLFYDDTSDSTAYHADGILQLLQGINPIYEWMHGLDDVWTNHYPKATWYLASLIIHLTGNYNLGKFYDLILLYAVFAYVFSFTRRRGFSIGNSLLVAVAASVNPVTISQLLSFYVDGALASLTTLAIFSGLALINYPRNIDRFVFFTAACLLINIKFTGAAHIFIIGCICAGVMLYRWKKADATSRQVRTLITTLLLTALVGGLFMGFNPYIENMMTDGNPLFPLFGKGRTDVVAAQSPRSFNEHHTSTPVKLLLSMFSRSENVIYKTGTAEPRLKVPFTVGQDEISVFVYQDVRIGGWGVLFSGIVLLAIIAYCGAYAWRDHEIAIGLLFIICMTLINPGSWWARYAPQVALLPLLMAIPPLAQAAGWQRITAKFVFALLILNSILILIPNLQHAYNTTETINRQIKHMIAICGTGKYAITGNDGYHVEQFLTGSGIMGFYPERNTRELHHQEIVFPLGTDDYAAYLYKEGCIKH